MSSFLPSLVVQIFFCYQYSERDDALDSVKLYVYCPFSCVTDDVASSLDPLHFIPNGDILILAPGLDHLCMMYPNQFSVMYGMKGEFQIMFNGSHPLFINNKKNI